MDRDEQLRVLTEAQGNPALLALATVDLTFTELSKNDRERLRTALETAAIPHWADEEVLTEILDRDLAAAAPVLLARLRNLTVVEPFPARGLSAVNVHQSARLAIRGRLATESPERLRSLSRRASVYFGHGTADHVRVEAAYHLLLCEASAGLRAVEALLEELDWRAEHEPLRTLAAALDEVLDRQKSNLLTPHERGIITYVTARIRWDYPRPEDGVERTFEVAGRSFGLLEGTEDAATIALVRDLLGEIRCARGGSSQPSRISRPRSRTARAWNRTLPTTACCSAIWRDPVVTSATFASNRACATKHSRSS